MFLYIAMSIFPTLVMNFFSVGWFSYQNMNMSYVDPLESFMIIVHFIARCILLHTPHDVYSAEEYSASVMESGCVVPLLILSAPVGTESGRNVFACKSVSVRVLACGLKPFNSA